MLFILRLCLREEDFFGDAERASDIAAEIFDFCEDRLTVSFSCVMSLELCPVAAASTALGVGRFGGFDLRDVDRDRGTDVVDDDLALS